MTPARRLLAFCIVGTIGLLVDLAVLYATEPLLGWYAGRVLSFAAAATTTWYFNGRYTFADAPVEQGERLMRQYLRYVFSMLGGAAVNYAIYALTMEYLPLPHAPAWGVAFGSVGSLTINFASARFLVFRASTRAKV